MQLAKREKILFYATIIVILAALLQRFAFHTLNSKLKTLNHDILIQGKALRKGLRAYNLRDQILNDYRKYGDHLKIKGSDEEITARLLKEIEELARKSKSYLVDIKPQPSKKTSYYKKFIIEIKTEATLEELIRFLYYLDKSPFSFRVEKLALVGKKDTHPTVLKVGMLINAVFL